MHCQQTFCRYQYTEFRVEVAEALEKLTVTSQNLMFTATTAKNYAIFEDVSNMLIRKCGEFLKTKMSTSEDVFNFLLTSHSTFPDGKTELLMELLRANGKCFNCKSRPCLVGQDITPSQEHSSLMWKGMVVSKKEPPSEGTCGFPCDQSTLCAGLSEETAGLALIDNLQTVPNPNSMMYTPQVAIRGNQGQPVVIRNAISLQCITHNVHIKWLSQVRGRTQQVDVGNPLVDSTTNLANFVFACGVARQLSWQNIMG